MGDAFMRIVPTGQALQFIQTQKASHPNKVAVKKVLVSGIKIILHTFRLERTTFWMEVHYSQKLINTPYYWCPMLQHICVDVKTKFLRFSGVLTWLFKKQMKMKTLLKKLRMLYVHCTLHVVLPFVFPEGDCVIHVDCIVHVFRQHWVIIVPLLIFFSFYYIFIRVPKKRKQRRTRKLTKQQNHRKELTWVGK